MTFSSAEDLAACMGHEKHCAFAATFMAALDNVVVVDFPFVFVKPAPPPSRTAQSLPPYHFQKKTLFWADSGNRTPPSYKIWTFHGEKAKKRARKEVRQIQPGILTRL